MTNTVSFPNLGWTFTFPYAIQIGSFQLTFYGIVIALGLLLALVYGYRNFRKVGVDPDKATDAIIGGVIGGILGARLYFVAFRWEDYGLDFSSWEAFWNTFSRIFMIWEGGLAIYGGIIGALLVGLLIAKWRKIKFGPLLDVVGVGFLLGQGIGRWGNFFNVEAFGSNTTLPWGMTGPRIVQYLTVNQTSLEEIGVTVDPTMPVHPTFLYESLWCLLGFVLLSLYMKHRKFDGEVFCMYLAFYGIERFVVEGLRTDSLMIGALRVSQLLAGVLTVAAILIIVLVRSKIRGNHDENYMKLYALTEEGQKIVNNVKEEPTAENAESDTAAEDSNGELSEEEEELPEDTASDAEDVLESETAVGETDAVTDETSEDMTNEEEK